MYRSIENSDVESSHWLGILFAGRLTCGPRSEGSSRATLYATDFRPGPCSVLNVEINSESRETADLDANRSTATQFWEVPSLKSGADLCSPCCKAADKSCYISKIELQS
jgi:hypothetical protein